MSFFMSASMFFLSFLPLWVAILFIDGISICESKANILTESISIILIFLLFVLASICMSRMLNPKKNENKKKFTIISAVEQKNVTFELLLTCVLPLFAFDFTVWKDVVLFLVFFFFLGFLCIKHNMFYVNIVLELLNYRYYSCTLENKDGVRIEKNVISKEILSLKQNEEISAYAINNDYMIGFKEEQ